MASNLMAPINFGELNACVFRAARLDPDCSPTQGTSGGIVSAGIVTMTATPVVSAGAEFTQKNGCGRTLYSVKQDDTITGYTLSGEMAFADFEMLAMLFDANTLLGAVGGPFAGKVMGYYDRLYSRTDVRNGVYLEIITTTVVEGAGDCASVSGASVPVAIGHIFPKAKLNPGAMTFANDLKRVTFDGNATNNPSVFDGPWNDFPAAGYVPNSSHIEVGYSQTQYNAILAAITPGYVDLPVTS